MRTKKVEIDGDKYQFFKKEGENVVLISMDDNTKITITNEYYEQISGSPTHQPRAIEVILSSRFDGDLSSLSGHKDIAFKILDERENELTKNTKNENDEMLYDQYNDIVTAKSWLKNVQI